MLSNYINLGKCLPVIIRAHKNMPPLNDQLKKEMTSWSLKLSKNTKNALDANICVVTVKANQIIIFGAKIGILAF